MAAITPFRNREELDREDLERELSPMDRVTRSSWLTKRRALVIGGAAVAALLATIAFVKFGMASSISVSRDRLTIATVQEGAFHDYIPVTGSVQPRQTVYLDAVDGGQVAEVLVEEGASVAAGQPLVKLNNANLQLQVINSEAQLSEQLNRLTSTKLQFENSQLSHQREQIDLEFQIEQATQQYARVSELGRTGVVRRADVEDAELQLKRLRRMKAAADHAAEVDEKLQRKEIETVDRTIAGLNKNLSIARQNLDNLVIKAPIAGQLTALTAHAGESKTAGQRLGQIDEVDNFKIVATVDEHYLDRVAVGEHAGTELGGATQALELTKVYPEVRDRLFKVDLAFAKAAPASARRGQTLQLRLQIGDSSHGLIIPNGGFYDDTAGEWIFVLTQSGSQAVRRPVRLGRRSPDSIEVLDGLRPGDRVITSSYESLKQFDQVRLRGG